MDILPLIDQALSDVGIDADDDPQLVALLRAAAPTLAKWTEQVREHIEPKQPRNGVDIVVEETKPQRGTLAYDLEAGIPVFARRGRW